LIPKRLGAEFSTKSVKNIILKDLASLQAPVTQLTPCF
jgi:hypothetical protein